MNLFRQNLNLSKARDTRRFVQSEAIRSSVSDQFALAKRGHLIKTVFQMVMLVNMKKKDRLLVKEMVHKHAARPANVKSQIISFQNRM